MAKSYVRGASRKYGKHLQKIGGYIIVTLIVRIANGSKQPVVADCRDCEHAARVFGVWLSGLEPKHRPLQLSVMMTPKHVND